MTNERRVLVQNLPVLDSDASAELGQVGLQVVDNGFEGLLVLEPPVQRRGADRTRASTSGSRRRRG